MKWIIANPKTNKLLTINTFNSVDECLKEVTSKTRYWKKLVKKKQLPTDRLKAWKNSIFLCINWEKEVFSDVEMNYKQETSKSNKQSSTKALKEYDQRRIQDKIDLSIKNSSKFKKYARKTS